ncbi:class I SAM-dependent methyltransferase [Reinekea forsetii]|nr:class I SAM-dependent methyltransferase [Reinekea forsetii]
MNQQNDSWTPYYQKTKKKPHHPRTEKALGFLENQAGLAIDCGCGTGADAYFLANQGLEVIAFDYMEESIELCRERFADTPNVKLTQSSFETFSFPSSDLVVANASLFFADPMNFDQTWQKIENCLLPGGVFSGDFMGPNDSWADGKFALTCPLTKAEVLALFKQFEVLEFSERDETGQTVAGIQKHWHTYSVIAKKLS